MTIESNEYVYKTKKKQTKKTAELSSLLGQTSLLRPVRLPQRPSYNFLKLPNGLIYNRGPPSKHTTWLQRRYNVAVTSL